MSKPKRKKPKPKSPRRRRRKARLKLAKQWIKEGTGCASEDLFDAYRKRFNVDWRCAASDLTSLGVAIDPGYSARLEQLKVEKALRRKAKRQKRRPTVRAHWHPFTDTFEAYLAGDFAALYDLEMRERYGVDWESHVTCEFCSLDDNLININEESEGELESSEFYEEKMSPRIDDDWAPF